MRDAPAFQFYASDLIASEPYKLMCLQERGLYLSMLAQVWISRTVPSAPAELARLVGADEAAVKAALTDRVMTFFERAPGPGERLRHPELDAYRQDLKKRREERSRSGKKGVARRRELNVTHSTESANPHAQLARAVTALPEGRKAELSRGKTELSRGAMSRGEGNRAELSTSSTYRPHRTEEERRQYEEKEAQFARDLSEAFGDDAG